METIVQRLFLNCWIATLTLVKDLGTSFTTASHPVKNTFVPLFTEEQIS